MKKWITCVVFLLFSVGVSTSTLTRISVLPYNWATQITPKIRVCKILPKLPKAYHDFVGDNLRDLLNSKIANVPTGFKTAQGILESAGGTSYLADSTNNCFGIKAFNNWLGRKWKGTTSYWRAYNSQGESVIDHTEFLVKHYSHLTKNLLTTKEFLRRFRGYASSITYKQKLLRIITEYGLEELDTLNIDSCDCVSLGFTKVKPIMQKQNQVWVENLKFKLHENKTSYEAHIYVQKDAEGLALHREPIPLETTTVRAVADAKFLGIVDTSFRYDALLEKSLKGDGYIVRKLVSRPKEMSIDVTASYDVVVAYGGDNIFYHLVSRFGATVATNNLRASLYPKAKEVVLAYETLLSKSKFLAEEPIPAYGTQQLYDDIMCLGDTPDNTIESTVQNYITNLVAAFMETVKESNKAIKKIAKHKAKNG